MKQYKCPTCSNELVHVQTEDMHESDNEWYRVHFECMTCPVLSIVIDVPTADQLPIGGVPSVQRDIVGYDNRDDNTTWLWISSTEYVEVNPRQLYDNMIENCYPGD